MKFKVLLLLLIFIICCKQSKKESNQSSLLTKIKVNRVHDLNIEKEEIHNNKGYVFDSVLKCQKYDYRPENIYSWGDYGCLYAPKGNNKYGNIIIYLIPKNGINKYYENYIGKDDENIDSEGIRVNGLSVTNIKDEFYIYLSLLDKQYLEHTPNLDTSYNLKQSDNNSYKFFKEWFRYNDSIKKWELLDRFETSPKTSRKAWEWEEEKVKEVISENQ